MHPGVRPSKKDQEESNDGSYNARSCVRPSAGPRHGLFPDEGTAKPGRSRDPRAGARIWRGTCAPLVNAYWERGEFPFELIPKIAALNIAGDHNMREHGCRAMTAV